MGWDATSRVNLAASRAQGAVVVRFSTEGCETELEVLSGCSVPLAYEYRGYNANDRILARTPAELRSQMPIGASTLLPKIDAEHSIRADYALAGVYRLPSTPAVDRTSLQGDCSRATHLVSAIFVGGFGLVVGNKQKLIGAGGVFSVSTETNDDVERLAFEGSPDACKAAQRSGKLDERCVVPLKLGLISLNKAPEVTRVVAPPQGSTTISSARGTPNLAGSTTPRTEVAPTSPRRWCLATASLGNPTPMGLCETTEARCLSTMIVLNKNGSRITEPCSQQDAVWCHHRKYPKSDENKEICQPSKERCEASLREDRWGGTPIDACAPIDTKGEHL
jgi:hypothetical protein